MSKRVAALLLLMAASGIGGAGCNHSIAVSSPPSSTRAGSPPDASAATGSPTPSAASAALLLKVTSEGGFINPVASLNALPIVEVYTDGRILTPGPQDAIAPSPLLSPVEVRNVGVAGAASIAKAVHDAGLDRPASAGPGIPGDAGTDVFSVTIAGETTETRLAGNGAGVGGPGAPGVGPRAGSGDPSAAVDPERAAAFLLLTRLLDSTDAWGGSGAEISRYAPSGYRIFAAPLTAAPDATTPPDTAVWPLSTTLAQFGSAAQPDRGIAGLRQGAVVGADAATLGPVFAKATQDTAFTSGGTSWTLYVRALLPDELPA